MRRLATHLVVVLLLLPVSVVWPGPRQALAQDSSPSAEPLVREEVIVSTDSTSPPVVTSGTRTPTSLRDVPQAISVVSRTLIADQRLNSIADVVRYMPGVSIAQGEGNRDTPILRGNSTTADFFVDGVRDDVQYFRDVYNVERVEALKGPNAMIFGRGGVGGVINRVTRQADWGSTREVALQVGSWGNHRYTADLGAAMGRRAAFRVTGVYEDTGSYRRGVDLERTGTNPTFALRLGSRTTLRAGYEYFHDRRTADRGVPSLDGRPVETSRGTFFGDPRESWSEARVHVVTSSVDHQVTPSVVLRNRISYGDYDKFYQNVFPGTVNGTAGTVSISAYNNATTRRNLFNQTDVVATASTGGVRHTILAGAEFGRQATGNFRQTGYFAGATALTAPLADPTIDALGVVFRQSASDADNDGVATLAAAYVQDQTTWSHRVQTVMGVRLDAFRAAVTNHRTGTTASSDDTLVSPRVGVIYTLTPSVSFYSSYSLSYLPRAGEQLASLSLTNQALEPEKFTNYEVGTKWDIRSQLSVSLAVYRLQRTNVAVPDPVDPTVTRLVDGQQSQGLELEWTGRVTPAWHVTGGYAWQDGAITQSISASARAGARLAQLPAHSFALWSKHVITRKLAAGVGVIRRGSVFTSTDNLVVLPAWSRFDAGLFYNLTTGIRAQLNIENLLDRRYFPNAHGNTNITPGAPRSAKAALIATF